MKVSTRGRYGLGVLLDIALHQGGGPVALRDIARRHAISQKYLWQVVTPMKAAGLLRAERGMRGGYSLTRDPGEVSLREIVGILEGPIGAPGHSGRMAEPAFERTVREAWGEVWLLLNRALEHITLGDLVQRFREHETGSHPNYTI